MLARCPQEIFLEKKFPATNLIHMLPHCQQEICFNESKYGEDLFVDAYQGVYGIFMYEYHAKNKCLGGMEV